MLETIIILIVLFWLLGWVLGIGGALIHVALVMALVLFVLNQINKRS